MDQGSPQPGAQPRVADRGDGWTLIEVEGGFEVKGDREAYDRDRARRPAPDPKSSRTLRAAAGWRQGMAIAYGSERDGRLAAELHRKATVARRREHREVARTPRPHNRRPAARTPRPRARRVRTAATRAGPDDSSGEGEPDPDDGIGRAENHLDLDRFASTFTARALSYFAEHAIEPEVAAGVGVREHHGGLTFTYTAPDGSTFERRRALDGGPAKVRQPAGVGLCLWWPEGRPA